jgi:hypothetical protein
MVAVECQTMTERASLYVNGALSASELREFEQHVSQCEACGETLRQVRAVHGLMEYIEADAPAARVATPANIGWRERLGQAPWWLVSCSLHVLVIALAGLISMAIEAPRGDDAVIMVTELSQPDAVQDNARKEKPDATDILESKAAKSDPASTDASNVVIPPDILAKADVGDHFETINLDRADTHSAYGAADSESFHSVSGNADAAGGGGTGGVGLEDAIGVGGAGSRGSGGGFGGGDGTGIGTGSGAGKGSFGQRTGGGRKLMVKRNGGSKATESAVDRGLDWLARNQEADGHWDAAKHGGEGKFTDVAITGWALLAFLGAGHTEKVGKYKDNVIRGVNWLITGQNPKSGLLCDNYGYSHAIAGMALAEAAGMARVDRTKEAAQLAVNCTCFMQIGQGSEKSGWCYGWYDHEFDLSRTKDCDLSNSGWHMMFLKSAKVAGLKVPTTNIEGLVHYLKLCERGRIAGDPYSGHRYVYQTEQTEDKITFRRCSIGILCSLFFGTPANEVEDGVKYMIDKGGLPKGPTPELYYIYYGTLLTFQVGGDVWQRWNEALKATLLPLQVNGGPDDGSWSPDGTQMTAQWGRVGQTALSILCMEVYYRYQKLAH